MKKKFIYVIILFTSFIFAGCSQEEPNQPIPGGNSGEESEPTISFTYQIVNIPFEVEFSNTSSNLSDFHWDFGDGRTADTKNVRHIYNKLGEYTVTLSGYTENGRTYTCRQKIVLERPNIHISGYQLLGIPYYNQYYCIAVSNEETSGSGWDFSSIYTPKLTSGNIPYTYNFVTDIVMDEIEKDSYYYVYVFHSKNSSPNDDPIQCMKQILSVGDILECRSQYLFSSNNGETIMYLRMRYD